MAANMAANMGYETLETKYMMFQSAYFRTQCPGWADLKRQFSSTHDVLNCPLS